MQTRVRPLGNWGAGLSAESATFHALCEALRGRSPRDANWEAQLTLANRTLTTPALATALEGKEGIPRDVASFLTTISERARQRHAMMRGQLCEAVAALDTAGIMPILIKGAAFMADGSRQATPSRRSWPALMSAFTRSRDNPGRASATARSSRQPQ